MIEKQTWSGSLVSVDRIDVKCRRMRPRSAALLSSVYICPPCLSLPLSYSSFLVYSCTSFSLPRSGIYSFFFFLFCLFFPDFSLCFSLAFFSSFFSSLASSFFSFLALHLFPIFSPFPFFLVFVSLRSLAYSALAFLAFRSRLSRLRRQYVYCLLTFLASRSPPCPLIFSFLMLAMRSSSHGVSS